jgi:hypothetical protein
MEDKTAGKLQICADNSDIEPQLVKGRASQFSVTVGDGETTAGEGI